ncbi:amino acid adenylation domain-containing protein, partial [Paenibacillus sp. HJL G12]
AMQPVPVGVTGDLYIGGIQLARGYHVRPELTQERFLPDPFSDEAGSRIYKTGDLARYLPDGSLEYAGRSDDQIKLRGFRIELGEIEAALLKHPKVLESAVIARDEERGGKRLIGYWVSQEPGITSAAELRNFLKGRLPEYMVPVAWMELERMPLTPSGKTDRKKLPMPQDVRSEVEAAFVAPESPAERQLAEIWKEVLGVQQVGVHDNFFTLGGDSIRSISVLSKARHEGILFTLQQLFEYPTIYSLLGQIEAADSLENLDPIEAFSLLSPADASRLRELAIEDAYPLTALQAGLVYHSELRPHTAIYHDMMSFTINSRFYSEPFAAALRHLVRRHPILRTTFDLATYTEPIQMIHPEMQKILTITDLRALTVVEQEEALRLFKESERQLRFDWGQPLVRFFVHILSDEMYCATLSFHDSMLDGWSVNSLITELFTDYSNRIAGTVRAKSTEPVPFREYVALEREALASDEAKHFWQETLEEMTFGAVPRVSSPSDATREILIRYLKVDISQHVSDGLIKLSEQMGVPLKSILLAVHLRIMGLLGGTEDVLTGLEHNGRPELPGGESMLGLFLNTVPFRLNLNLSEGSWSGLIRETYKTETALLPYRRYPLAQIQRGLGGQRLFETVFNYTHFHVAEKLLDLADLSLVDMDAVLETDFPLRAEFGREIAAGNIRFELHYDAGILPESRVRNIAGYYQKAFSNLLNDPESPFMQQNLLSEEEVETLLYRWNHKEPARDSEFTESSFPQLFEKRAALYPSRIAATYLDQHITYRELDERSNKVARELMKQGAGPEVCVAVLGERNLDFLVILLGILKSGGVYVPLDPRYPDERIQEMIVTSGSRMVIAAEEFVTSLQQKKESPSRHRICDMVSMTALLQASHSTEPLQKLPDREQLAYIIFTSGSTGKPKGAMVEHKGLMNHLYAKISDLHLTGDDIIAQNASQCFDISVWQFLAGLLVGGSVHICEEELVYNASAMLQVIERRGITILEMVPSVIRTMLDQTGLLEEQLALHSLRWMVPTGEALPPDLVGQWFKQYAHVPMMNAYGPTECSDDVTHYPIYQEPSEPWNTVPIGRPVANMSMYVMDRHLNLVPIGVPGELYVGGIGVGRGYINNPQKTTEVFLSNPFHTSSEARLYKTGDLVRYLEDGNLEFLGRIDHQVKIRGHRIEIGEIETALARIPAIRESVVVAMENDDQEKYLVGYVVPYSEMAVSVKELRSDLKRHLPDYCIPSQFIVLDALPLTPNGKLDRKKLPRPDQCQEQREEPIHLPENKLQQTIADVWQAVLKKDRIGIEDNFFEIGGDSLRLMQVHSRLQQELDCEIAIADLFKYPTVKSLTMLLQDAEEQDKRNQEELTEIMERAEQRKEMMKKRKQARGSRK